MLKKSFDAEDSKENGEVKSSAQPDKTLINKITDKTKGGPQKKPQSKKLRREKRRIDKQQYTSQLKNEALLLSYDQEILDFYDLENEQDEKSKQQSELTASKSSKLKKHRLSRWKAQRKCKRKRNQI